MVFRFAAFAVIVATLLGANGAHAQTTYTWTGAASALWSNPGNWSPGGVPANGDALVFPSGPTRLATQNDLPAGLSLTTVQIPGANYQLAGNGIVVTNMVRWTGAGNVISLAVDFQANGGTFEGTFAGAQQLLVSGGVSGTGSLALNGSMRIRGAQPFAGPITISCSFSCGQVELDGASFSAGITMAALDPGLAITLFGSGNTATVTANGGTIVPSTGAGDPGVLTVGALTLNAASTLGGLIRRPVAGTGYSQVVVTGSVTINNASPLLQVDPAFIPGVGQVLTLVDNRGANPVAGGFGGLPEGSPVPLNGVVYALSYAGGNGNDVTLTSTLTPKTWTGAVDANWSTAGNWSPAAVPRLGDFLVFPAGAPNAATNNDIAGLRLQGLSLGGGFTVSGSALVVGERVTWSGSGNTLGVTLDFDGNAVAFAQEGPGGPSDLVLTGAVNGTGSMRLEGPVRVNGVNGFAGTVTAQCATYCGALKLANATFAVPVTSTGGTVLGSGTIGALASTNGTLAPAGAGSGGQITTGNLALTSGAVAFNVAGATTPGVDYGQVVVLGTVSLGAATLQVTPDPGLNLSVGQSLVLIANDGADAVTGTFAGLPQDATLVLNGQLYRISYAGGDGNDVVLTRIARFATSTAVTASANPAAQGDSVTFTATVTSASGTPTGTATFKDGTTTLATVALTGGIATHSTSTLSVGTHTITVEFNGDPTFAPSSGTVSPNLLVTGTQSITFNGLPGRTFGDAPFTVAATGGGSGNPVTFSSLTTGTCTTGGTNGATVTLVAAGLCTIAADQAAGGGYFAAPQVTQDFTIAPASQDITFGTLGNRELGSGTFTVSATGGASGNPVTFSSQTGAVCATSGVNGTTVSLSALGTCTIAADQVGSANYAAAATVARSFQVVDTQAPDTTLTGTPTALSNSASATFTFTGTDNTGGSGVASFQCALDGAAFATCTSPRTLTALAEGSHTFQVRAVDGGGNVDPSPASFTWSIDLTLPALAFTSKPAITAANQAAYAVAGTCSEDGRTVNVQVGSIAATPTCGAPTPGQFATGPLDATGLAQGSVALSATQSDEAGNSRTVNDTTTKDTVGPALTIDALDLIGNGNRASYAFGGTCESGGGSVGYTLASGAMVSGSVACGSGTYTVSGLDVTALTDGTVSFTITQSDALGNPATATGGVAKDTVNPTLSFDASGAIRVANVTAYTVSGTCSENGRIVAITIGAVTANPTCTGGAFTATLNLTALADGPVAIQGSHADLAGNTATATLNVTKDTLPPAAPVVTAPSGTIFTATPTVTGTAEANSTVAVSIDGASVGTTTANGSGAFSLGPVATLAVGAHTVQATATDAVGNIGNASTVVDFYVAPTIAVAPATLADGTVAAAYAATITASGGTASYTFAVTAGALPAGLALASGGALSGTPTTAGAFTFTITATDANTTNGPFTGSRSYTVTIGTGAQAITFAALANRELGSGPFTLSATGGGSGNAVVFTSQTSGVCTATGTNGTTLTLLALGTCTIDANQAGNANYDAAPTVTRSFTVQDTLAPDTTFTSTPATLTNSASATFAFTGSDSGSGVASFQCALDGAAFAACTSPATLTGLAEGTHTYQVRAVDGVGNVDATPASFTWSIDLTGPVLAFTSKPIITGANQAAYSVAGTCSENGRAVGVQIGSIAAAGTCGTPANGQFATGPVDVAALAQGAVALSATQADAAGNTTTVNDATSKDSVGPALTIDALDAISNGNRTAYAFGGTCESGGGSVGYTLVSGATVSGSVACGSGTYTVSGLNVTALTDGTVGFTVTQSDALGNPATATGSVAKDTVNPTLSFDTSGALNAANVAAYTVSGTCSENARIVAIVIGTVTANPTCTGGAFTATVNLTTLADGPVAIQGTHADAAGNTATATLNVTKDTLAPAAPVVTAPAGTIFTATPTVTGTAEGGSTVAVSIDGASAGTTTANGAGAWSLGPVSALAVGAHTVRATATDVAGNAGPASSVGTFYVAPTIVVTPATLVNCTVDASCNQSVSATGGTAPYTFAVTAGALPTNLTLSSAGALSGTPTTAGAFTFTVTATDANTTNGPFTGSRSYTVSVASASQAISFGTLGNRELGSGTFTVSATGGASGNAVVFTSQTPATCATSGTNGTTVGLLSLGICTIAANQGGNANYDGAPTVQQSFQVVDTQAPDTAFTSTPGTLTNSASATFAFTGSDNAGGSGVASFQCALDGAGFAACTSPVTLTGLAGGTHTYQVRAVDGGGNVDATPASFTWTIDLAAPTLAFTSKPVITAANQAAYSVAGTCSEDGRAVAVQVGSIAATATCGTPASGQFASSAVNATALPQGAVALTATQVDAAGNSTTVNDATSKDSVGPTLTIDPLDVITNGNRTTYAFGGTCESGGGSVGYTVTSGAVVSGTVACGSGTYAVSGLNLTSLSDGTVTFAITQADALGNTASASGTVAKDTVNPSVSFDALGPVNGANAAAYTVSGSCSENGRTVAITIGTVNANPTCTAGAYSVIVNLATLADGPVTLQASTADASGNTATATLNVTKDATAPAAPVVTGPSGTGTNANPTITGTAEANGFVAVRVDGSLVGSTTANGSGAWSVGPVSLGTGAHAIVARATDGVGNISAASSTVTYTVVPTIVLSPASLLGATVGQSFAQALGATGGVSPYGFAVTVGALPSGMSLSGAGVLSGTPTVAGGFAFTVTATDADPNGPFTGTRSYTLSVAKGAQSIAFNALGDREMGSGSFGVTATAGSGLAVAFSSLTTATCTVSGGTVALVAPGTCTIAADQAGDANWNAASQVTRSFTITPAPVQVVTLSRTAIDFGGQSMGTTSPEQLVTVTNNTLASITVNSVLPGSPQFGATHDCATLAVGASCTVHVTFSPAPTGAALNAAVPVAATLSIASTGPGSPHVVTLDGSAEKSLVTHYYRAILGRAPDAGGKQFWHGEAQRVSGQGLNVNETWYALAAFFFSSQEYVGANPSNADFVTDLYLTFFNRAPDGGGLGFWTGQLQSGMPREVVLASFMFSTEFVSFTQGIFGNTLVRPELDMVGDFYRGLLARLGDNGGVSSWVQRFRAAQCAGVAAVTAEVESMSSQFATGPEYANRARSNRQYVGDLYNAFLRRGGDLAGVNFWINALDTGAMTREQVRRAFVGTPEFTARVNGVAAQPCMP